MRAANSQRCFSAPVLALAFAMTSCGSISNSRDRPQEAASERKTPKSARNRSLN